MISFGLRLDLGIGDSRGRARGRDAQRERRQMRAMPRMREVAVDEAMTSFGGVAGFATFCRERSIDDIC